MAERPAPRRRNQRRSRTAVLPDPGPDWSIGDQSGRTVLVTGANAGLGFVTATEFAAAGANVVLAVRDLAKGEAALVRLRERVPDARVGVQRLDLADLDSVAECAAQIDRLDVLINNAGVMLVPERRLTADGFELQLGTNHLGHFALTVRLLPVLLRSPNPRVVSLSSIAHRLTGRLRPDLGVEGPYRSFRAYAQSKLACASFGFELDRRAKGSGWPLTSVVAHPGYVATELFTRQADPGLVDRLTAMITPSVGSAPEHGALSQLRAATDPTFSGGEFIGPRWWVSGPPVVKRPGRNATRRDDAALLWRRSEELTGLTP